MLDEYEEDRVPVVKVMDEDNADWDLPVPSNVVDQADEYPEGLPESNVVVQDQGILTIPGTDCTADALHMYDSREVEYEKLPIGDEKLIVDDVAADLFTPLKSTHQLPE